MSFLVASVVSLCLAMSLLACSSDGAQGAPAHQSVDDACPEQAHDGACSSDGMICTYGADRRLECRARITCAGGMWAPADKPTWCQSPEPSGCPASPTEPRDFCAVHGGVTCAYDETECACLPPQGSANPNDEAFWGCYHVSGDDDCPSKAPNLGTACKMGPSALCVYGYACRAEKLRCAGGVWVSEGIQGC